MTRVDLAFVPAGRFLRGMAATGWPRAFSLQRSVVTKHTPARAVGSGHVRRDDFPKAILCTRTPVRTEPVTEIQTGGRNSW